MDKLNKIKNKCIPSESQEVTNNNNNKKCTCCKKEKTMDNFRYKRNGDLNNTCNNCRDINKKSHNKNKCSHGSRKYECVSCEGLRICQHKRRRDECKDCNIKGCLRHNIMIRMSQILGYSDIDYLCCNMDEFIEHIESQFEGDMSWSTYGITFELDHIKPLNGKNISIEEKINRFCYLNVRPLSISENRRKGNKDEL